MRPARLAPFFLILAIPSACGDSESPSAAPPSADRYSVRGDASGLSGPLTLSLNGAEPLVVEADGPFAFTSRLADGAAFDVTVTAEPAGQACAVSGGAGQVAGADVTGVAVTCARAAHTLGGHVAGLTTGALALREAVSGQTVTIAAGAPSYAFAPIEDGSAYDVAIDSSPPGLACAVANATGTLDADVADADVACQPLFDDLVLSEIGATFFSDAPAWIELHNASGEDVSLAGYALRVRGLDRVDFGWKGGLESTVTFALPEGVVPAGGFVVVAGKAFDDLHDGAQAVYVLSGGRTVPFWDDSGSVELVRAASGETVDYVGFGAGGAAPATPSAWAGAPAPALPNAVETAYGTSLARDLAAPDTNGAADWHLRAFATPAGDNDVTSDVDADDDGIPDQAEQPGGTFAGLPLYDYGARAGQRDVFVEIDWMDPKGFDGTTDAALVPRKEALDKVTSVFAARGFSVHFDTGDLHDGAPGIDPAAHDLGGGEEVPFACGVTLGFGWPPEGGVASFAALKASRMDYRRKPIFHYAVFASTLGVGPCSEAGSSGLAEAPGNDFLVTLGRWGLGAWDDPSTNTLVNFQAATVMHELGHNLGLFHGGNEDTNYKPNYLSVMNYLYGLNGLPALGAAGDRYYYYHGYYCGGHGVDDLPALSLPPTGDPASFLIDYSDGSSGALAKGALDESKGLLREGSAPIDFDWDFAIEDHTSARVDAEEGNGGCQVKSPGSGSVTDHDDWSALYLTFARGYWGEATGPKLTRGPTRGFSPDVHGDRQPLAREERPPAWYLEQVRRVGRKAAR
jgi:hypothetical protein